MSDSANLSFDNPTEEHLMLRQMVRNLAEEVVEPQADEHDVSGKLNRELFRTCGELGLHGITVAAEHGGHLPDELADFGIDEWPASSGAAA